MKKLNLKTIGQLALTIGIFCLGSFGYGQKFTLSGTIIDAKNGETMIGTTVTITELPGTGVITNEYGFYSITLPEGRYKINYQTVGYETKTLDTLLNKNISYNVKLNTRSNDLKEFVVKGENGYDNITNPITGVEKINMDVINKLPVIFGERDILKSIQLLPGVQPAGEGNSGFFVRGGTTDQNLILLDEATVYNPSHLFGFFSTFNSDAIKDAVLYKGTAPAQYGGRIASVLDVRMNEGDNQNYHISGGIGLISSRLNVEGPIQKGKSSFLLTARRTYADLFLKLQSNPGLQGTQLYFYDLNAKMNFQIGKRARLYLSGYFGQDVLGLDAFELNWHNGTATARFNYMVSPKIFSNTIFTFSDYQNNTKIEASNVGFKLRSEIMDFNIRQEFQFYPSPKHSIRAGINSIYHIVTPGEIDVSGDVTFDVTGLSKRYSWENAAYASHEWNTNKWLRINYGVRLVNFNVMGEGDFYTLNNNYNVIDTTTYNSGEIVSSYFNIEPRVSFSMQVAKYTSIKVGYARHTQFLHLLSNSTANNPTDKWIPSSNIVRPEIADQVSLGFFQNFKKNMFEIGIEGYYKNLQNQIDYKDGADVLNNELYEADLRVGEGRAYGLEVSFKKVSGAFTGWISYTLSRTEKSIDEINGGNWYAAKQDRTHSLSLVAMYNLKRWTFSGTFVYYTGNAVTFPSGKYQVDGVTTFLYTERNGYRMPDYHRLDLGVTVDLRSKKIQYNKKGKEKRKMIVSELSFGTYNTYNRWNTFSISFQDDENDPSKTNAVSTTLFGIVPYISYNFKW